LGHGVCWCLRNVDRIEHWKTPQIAMDYNHRTQAVSTRQRAQMHGFAITKRTAGRSAHDDSLLFFHV